MLNPGQIIDRYTVESVIGHGGTAVVYLVRHNQLNSQHALKVLSLTSGAIRQRLLREGRVQAALQHTNIVSVTDVLDIDGNPGLLMEYIDGPSLDQAMRRYKISLLDALTLYRGVVSGVRAAHREGLVHRDLKPANVLLFRSPEGFVPKVTDFGLAKLLVGESQETGTTRQGIAMGTPAYMAPEQIRDARAVDQRADLFSLGCILYELSTRQRAFPGDQALDIYNNIVAGRYTPAEDLNPDLPDAVIQAIDGCLILDREERIPDCDSLIEVLSGQRTWKIVDHPIPHEPTQTEEIPVDAPSMPVALRKLTPVSAPPRGAAPRGSATTPQDLDRSPSDPGSSSRPRRRRLALMLGVLLMAPVLGAVLALLIVLGVGTSLWANPFEVIQDGPELHSTLPPSDEVPPHEPQIEVVPPPLTELDPEPPEPARDPPAPIEPDPPPPEKPSSSSAPDDAEVLLFSVPKTVAIRIDGADAGRTPKRIRMPLGEHRIEVISGEERAEFPILVGAQGANTWCYSFPEGRSHDGKCP
ncbi:MAG: serine/threonine protein kinase [Deltaproteobacteria bacterium]|nr:MAG: serine/threonine protein kinase [Deltaproteobacteria bacterium]